MVSTRISYENTIKVLYTSACYQWQNWMERPYIRKAIIALSLLYIVVLWIAAFFYLPFLGPLYLMGYIELLILTGGMIALAISSALYLENSAFLVFLIGFTIFLFSYYWLSIILIIGAAYVFYRILETRRWKNIYQVIEKSPEQLAKIDKKPKKDEPRVEITFRGADE